MRDEIQFQIMMPEASSQSLTVDTPAGGIQWVFYILSFKEEALSLNHLNRAIRFIAISYVPPCTVPINPIILTQLQGRTFYMNHFSPTD